MYPPPRSTFYNKNLRLTQPKESSANSSVQAAKENIARQLRLLGASRLALNSMEAKHLHKIIHPNEHIEGMVYGRTDDGFAMLLATDKRALYLDRKPFFTVMDEITYHVVSGVSHGRVGFISTVTLHTKVKDYAIRTIKERCARQFVSTIESRCIEDGA